VLAFIADEEIDGFRPEPVWLDCSFGYNQNVLPVAKGWSGDREG